MEGGSPCAELRAMSASKGPPRQDHRLLPGCQHFLFAELDAATGHFAEEHVIGEGGFGRVYRGAQWCGLPVAVKRLDRRGLQVMQWASGSAVGCRSQRDCRVAGG